MSAAQFPEKHLQAKSQEGNEMVMQVLRSLGGAVVYPDCTNFETNKKLWNVYAREWKPDAGWVKDMVKPLGMDESSLAYVGDEWSQIDHLDEVIAQYIQPFLGDDFIAAEIGSGGGRVAARVCTHVQSLHCFDISENMLKCAQQALSEHTNVLFSLLSTPVFPKECLESFDFVYSFDVFVHLDLHMMWQYIQEFHKILKPGGKAFISTANLSAPGKMDVYGQLFTQHSPTACRRVGTLRSAAEVHCWWILL
jgi:SAM-dependent methyltransferase